LRKTSPPELLQLLKHSTRYSIESYQVAKKQELMTKQQTETAYRRFIYPKYVSKINEMSEFHW
jgi:hypothetical protein